MKRVHLELGSEDAAAFLRLLDRARTMARPKAIYAESFVEKNAGDTVQIGGVIFTSRMLKTNLSKAGRVFPFVATCGREMDEIDLPQDDFLQQFWWDTLKASALASAISALTDRLKHQFRLGKFARMHPGSGDADVWPIQQQRELFSLLGDVQGQIGVELTSSFLMIPNKSASGIVFATESDFRSCQVCRRENCPNRAAPCDPALWDAIHDIRNLNSALPQT